MPEKVAHPKEAHMKRLDRPPCHKWWSHVLILLAVLVALASVPPTQAAMSVRLVKDINPAGANGLSSDPYFTAVGSTLFFVADDGVHGRELWTSDGTESGTNMVKDAFPNDGLELNYSELTAV